MATPERMAPWDCPSSFYGNHGVDRLGRCPWCGRKVGSVTPKPRMTGPSELTDAYRQVYDPDWSGDD